MQDVTLQTINSVTVHRLQDDTAIIDCEIEVVADFEFCLYNGNYVLFDDNSPIMILDGEWNEHYSLAATQARISAHAILRVSKGFYKIISKELYTKKVTVI